MFVRKKKNRSGSISVVVVSKAKGKFTEIRKFGVAESEEESESLFAKAKDWIYTCGNQLELDFEDKKGQEVESIERFIGNIDKVLINGTQLLLNNVYDSIGFNRIPDEILRHLIIARVSQPMSKLATVDYLKSYYDEVFYTYFLPYSNFHNSSFSGQVSVRYKYGTKSPIPFSDFCAPQQKKKTKPFMSFALR